MLFLLLFLSFLFPLALYCSFLFMVNRRLRPMMLSGLWDCVALLFGLSGFLLVVMPGLIWYCYQRELRGLIGDENTPPGSDAFDAVWSLWWAIWFVYFLIALGGAAWLLYARSSRSVIYNIEPRAFEDNLAQTLERLGLNYQRQGPRWTIASLPGQGPHADVDVLPLNTAISENPLAQRSPGEAQLEVDSFAPMCHVTLHWLTVSSPLLRREIEVELARTLAEVETQENPAASWLLGATSFLSALLFLGAVFGYAVRLFNHFTRM